MVIDAVVVESVQEGLRIYENPFGVLTNAPDFAAQRAHLALFAGLDAAPPHRSFVEGLPSARGAGAVGLPGDFGSLSRFVRAAFVNAHTEKAHDEDAVSRFFHMMESVSVPSGCVRTERGECVRTVYTSCADLAEGRYYFHTYPCRTPRVVAFDGCELDGDTPLCFFMWEREKFPAPKRFADAEKS